VSPEQAVRKFLQMGGLSLYRASGGLIRSTRHALIGARPVT
jgi:hypothetical protein